ncbi:MMPL family transporter [Terribacillus saccharophilus]|nr:MMPL family transporter [Terribacillus saccharophilus]MCM3226678.1 MMPL family transporter [Terribacillus saccharophilus]
MHCDLSILPAKHDCMQFTTLEEIKIAKLLYRLGKWAVSYKKSVVFGALALLVALAIVTVSLGTAFNEDLSIPNTPAEEANDLLRDAFPDSESGAQVQVVFKASDDETLDSEASNKVITDMLNSIQEDDSDVVAVATPVQLQNLNEDKTVGYGTVTFKDEAAEVSQESIDNVTEKVEETRDAGIQTELTGDVEFSGMHLGAGEIVGIIVAFLVLAVTFTSFLAAGMPILSALIGLGISLLTIVIGSNFFEMQNVSLTLAAMLGIAVGIDYALFIMTRFRQQLAEGHSVKESVAIATGTSGSAVVFAGLTVIIGLLGLAVTGIPFLTVMGVAASISILLSVIVSITVLPAVLGMLGHRIAPSKGNRFLKKITGTTEGKPSNNRWGKFVTTRPWLVTFLSVAILLIIAIPFTHMNLGLPDDGTAKQEDTTERKAYDIQADAYGEGFHSTLVVAAKIDADENVEEVQQDLQAVSQDISELDDVKTATPAMPNEAGDVFIISVTPETGPNDQETKDIVNEIRDLSNEDMELLVTGTAAVNIDIAQKLNDALPIFALLIVGLAYVLLVLVFRSILLPLKAVLGFLLSIGATLGFVTFVVQDGNMINLFGFPGESPILAFLPIIAIGILFGLAMDYEVFLVSRMREIYSQTRDPKEAILAGMRDSGKVVVAAGLIMMSVFVGFMVTPDAMIKSIGMALTFGVLFDAFVVRMTIVPAVMSLMGNAAWYMPKWLDKILPNIDIEGEALLHEKEKERKSS